MGGYAHSGGAGQLHPGGGAAGPDPVGPDPHDERTGEGGWVPPSAPGPVRRAADRRRGAPAARRPGADRRQPAAGGPDCRPEQPEAGKYPGGGLLQHLYALAAHHCPAVPVGLPGRVGRYPHGQCGGDLPVAAGGQGGSQLCQPPGPGPLRLGPPVGRPAAGHPAPGLPAGGWGLFPGTVLCGQGVFDALPGV